jgi:lipopolysaccharide transport system permease protein
MSNLATESWIENRPSRGWLPRVTIREVVSGRELVYVLAIRDLKLRYKQTFFGVAWALIQPLAGVAIFALVFGHFARLPSDHIPYPVFAYAGLLVWTYLSTSVGGAAESLVQHRSLVTKIYFPRLIAPLAAVLPALVDVVLTAAVLAVMMLIFGPTPPVTLILAPAWIVAAVALAFAVGSLLAALNVQYRDIHFALPFLLQLWFFASPIVYPSSLLHGAWRYLYALNPASTVIDGFRWAALGGPAPGTTALVSLGAWIVLLVVGLAYFARAEREFADRI